MPMSEERCQEIKAGAERIRRQRALIAEMATVTPEPEIEQTDWNFCLNRPQLENLLESLNADLAEEDGFENGGED